MPKAKIYNPGDLVGNNIIIEKDIEQTKEKKKSYWICKCAQCGKIRSVRSDNLNQKCRNCGSKKDKTGSMVRDDLTGRTFGLWKVIKKADKSNYWLCECIKCHNQREVFRGNLTQRTSKGDGCVKSFGEFLITQILNENNIIFKKEYCFNNLLTEKNGRPRFDFALFKNNTLYCLIEFDGKQHSYYDENWHITYEEFLELQNRDALKTQYCLNNNIKLFRLSNYDNIKEDLEPIIKEFKTKGNG